MAWKFDNETPVYIQIERRICADILNGKFPAESQLPSVRQIALDAAVNPNTVQKALCELEDRGIVFTKGTVGRFVTSDRAILDNERRVLQRELLRRFWKQALALGVSRNDIIQFLDEEES